MSPQFYYFLHMAGVVALFTALGGLVVLAAAGGSAGAARLRGPLIAIHGTALLVMLVAGFGLLGKLGIAISSGWVIGKLLIWLVLGAGIVLARRRVLPAPTLILAFVGLGIVAVYLAYNKPF